jgi:uncharacterized protein Yka (UPF0111/DUF47 family)
MLRRFLPKQDNFFILFHEASQQLVDISRQHRALLANLSQQADYLQQMQQLARAGDKTIHATLHLLHKTFITPFDRNDIHKLVSRMERIVHEIAHNGLTISLYELRVLPSEVNIVVNSSHRCAKMLNNAIEQLNALKNSGEILKCCDAVSDAQDTAQEIILTSIARLFKQEEDIKQLLKVREVFVSLKNIMQGYQELANVIRSIVLEYA